SARLRPMGLPCRYCGHSTRSGDKRLRRCWSDSPRELAGFLVDGVALVPAAVLVHLDALAVVDLALHRDVVAALALLARERDLHPLLVLRHGRRGYLTILTTRPEPTV